MSLRLRLFIMSVMLLAAAFSGSLALETLSPKNTGLPEEIYEKLQRNAEHARYIIKSSGGHVAVYDAGRGKELIARTRIRTAALRRADRAMLDKGIPIATAEELLLMLEDLSV